MFVPQGLNKEGQQEGILLGQFTYNKDLDPIQTFHFQARNRDEEGRGGLPMPAQERVPEEVDSEREWWYLSVTALAASTLQV